MKIKLLTIVLMLTIGIVSFFGFNSVDMLHSGNQNCKLSSFIIGDCPPTGDTVAVALHYIVGLKSLVVTAFINFNIVMLSILFIIISLLFFFFIRLKNHQYYYTISETLNFNTKKYLLRWIAILNRKYLH